MYLSLSSPAALVDISLLLYENASEESKQSQYNNAKINTEKVLFRVQLGSTRRTEELEPTGRLIFRAMRALNIEKKQIIIVIINSLRVICCWGIKMCAVLTHTSTHCNRPGRTVYTARTF
jgi:hypothetical protein